MSLAETVMLVMLVLATTARALQVLCLLRPRGDTKRLRARQQARQAEQRIAEIGAQTRTAIWDAMHSHTPVKAKAVRLDDPSFNQDGRYGPWND
jgi:hypothetical protein